LFTLLLKLDSRWRYFGAVLMEKLESEEEELNGLEENEVETSEKTAEGVLNDGRDLLKQDVKTT